MTFSWEVEWKRKKNKAELKRNEKKIHTKKRRKRKWYVSEYQPY